MRSTISVVVSLGTAQTLAWASSFYLPAMLAAPMARDLGLAVSTVYALLSMALIVSALLSPMAGRWIDRRGGRLVLMSSSFLFVLALLVLGLAQGPVTLVLAWLVMGVAMGCGLYDAAFAALVRLFGRDSRQSITGITLLAGFASTVGWPLSALMEAQWGWRGACLGWAALHLVLGLPLNAWLPGVAPVPNPAVAHVQTAASSQPGLAPTAEARAPRHLLVLLAFIFTLMGFVSTSIATHLPSLLQAAGATLGAAVALAALAGPAQVASRMFEMGVLQRFSPMVAARAATLGHPVAALLLLAVGSAAAAPFVVLHGLGNGLLTIVRGTLPLALFGPQGYGARQGWIALPGRMVGALSPWLFGLAIERWGVQALWLTCGAGLLALASLQWLKLPRH